MSLFKKFTDFCAGVAAFVAGLFLLQKYMVFKPLDDKAYTLWITDTTDPINEMLPDKIIEAPSKIKQFFTPGLVDQNNDYRWLALLVIVLMVSAISGIVFRKLPYVCFSISLIPALMIAYLLTRGLLYNQIGLYAIIGILHVAGNLIECTMLDREDGKHRLWICSKISLLFPAAFCLLCAKLTDVIDPNLTERDFNNKLLFYRDVATEMTKSENMVLVTKIGWMFFIILVVTVLLYDVYFIDAILTAIPLGYTIYLLYSGLLTFNPALFAFLAGICFISHLLLCVFESNLSKKEQALLKDQPKDEPKGKQEEKEEKEEETEAVTIEY